MAYDPSAVDAAQDGAAHESRPRPSWALIGIFLLLLVAGLAYAQVFLTPVILAFLLALVFSPVRRTLCRSGLSAGWAAALIIVALVAGMLTIGTLLATPVGGWLADAPTIGKRLEERVRQIRTSIAGDDDGKSVQEVMDDIQEAAAPTDTSVPTVVVKEDGVMDRLIAMAPAIVVQAVLVIVLLLFLLASGDMFYEKIVHVTPRLRAKRKAMQIAHNIERKLSRYLLTITAINAALGVAVGLAMWALGMPDPLLFGLIAWLFNYIPYVGAIAGSLLTLAVGLLTFDGLWAATLPAMAYYALTAIEGQFVTPYAVGRHLKLNTVVVFITIAFWAWLWSVVGMLVAVPLLVAVRTICEAIPSLQPVAQFLSARGHEAGDEEVETSPDATLPSAELEGSPAAR